MFDDDPPKIKVLSRFQTPMHLRDDKEITYQLCDMYVGNDKVVSDAAPACMADHLCERGKLCPQESGRRDQVYLTGLRAPVRDARTQ